MEQANAETMKQVLDLLSEGSDEVTLSSGVTVRIEPFPAGAWPRVQAKAAELHPDPEVPKKTIKVVDGTEEVDDPDAPGYQAARLEVLSKREELLSGFVLEFCVFPVDEEQMEGIAARMERYMDMPADPDERRVAFLSGYAMRTQEDKDKISQTAIARLFVGNKEVAERIRFFRRQMEEPAINDDDAPGADEDVVLDVQPEGDGAEGG